MPSTSELWSDSSDRAPGFLGDSSGQLVTLVGRLGWRGRKKSHTPRQEEGKMERSVCRKDSCQPPGSCGLGVDIYVGRQSETLRDRIRTRLCSCRVLVLELKAISIQDALVYPRWSYKTLLVPRMLSKSDQS